MPVVTLDKLVHGGQAIGALPDGRRVFVWNGLPGEQVKVELIKSKKRYAEAVAVEILQASPARITPKDEAYLSTSPWQICTNEAEREYKVAILRETFVREGITLPAKAVSFQDSPQRLQYRNKMEYSFWSDDNQLHLALFHRGSRKKRIITGSSIAMPVVDEAARRVRDVLDQYAIHGSQLKTVVVRANQEGRTVVALFVKDKTFPVLDKLRTVADGVGVYYSTPKSPASVITKELYQYGDIQVSDNLAGQAITYDVHSFFQVNVPVFSKTLMDMKKFVAAHTHDEIVDMYAGVGTIARILGASKMVEIDQHNIAMAKHNCANQEISIVHTSAEKALQHIPKESGLLIVDPPRAGLHQSLRKALCERLPQAILYLSCNPSTQARDVTELQSAYKLSRLIGYNYFPATPHIESLAILERK